MNEQTVPVEVTVKNFPAPDRNRVTAVQTYLIDPTGVAGPTYIQICEYNPKRCRLSIISGEVDAVLTLAVPTVTPDPTTTTLAAIGAFIPHTITAQREFFGPDAMWLNSVSGQTAGRVTVIKEYL